MNKEEELKILNRFKRLYPEFPEGTIAPAESPDFLLQGIGGKVTGIEITGLLQDDGYYARTLAQSDFKNKVTGAVMEKLQAMLPWCFGINIEIDHSVKTAKSKISVWAEEIAKCCYEEYRLMPDHAEWRIHNFKPDIDDLQPLVRQNIRSRGFRNLPLIVKDIWMMRFDDLTESFDTQSGGVIFHDLTIDDLSARIAAKERSLVQYKRCDQQWLIIYEQSLYGKVIITDPVTSTFDKIFLCRSREDQVLEIT